MKVVNICMGAPFTEGYSYQDNLLSQYQKLLGHEVAVITSTRSRGEGGREEKVSPGRSTLANGVRLIRLEAGGKLKRFFSWYPEIYSILKELQPDLIFVHGLASLVTAQAIRYKKHQSDPVCIVADNHQDSFNTRKDGFPFRQQLWLFRTLWKKWIKYVGRIYGTTSWRTAFANQTYGIPEEKLDTLVMGIDTQTMPEDPDAVRTALRKELEISREEFLFVTGGKLDSRKKILEAMEAFHRAQLQAKFLIFGSVDEKIKPDFDRYLQKDPRFCYVGYIPSEKAKQYFLAADFGVFPGGHSVLWEEAIGCGLPCLFRRYEEKDHVEVNGNCISIEDPGVEDIQSVLESVCVNKETHEQMKKAAQAAAEQFSYWKIAEKSLECATR